MTKGQQVILTIVILLLLGVMGLLAITLLNSNQAASSVPLLAFPPMAIATQLVDGPTNITVPSAWTLAPTRMSPASNTPRSAHAATAIMCTC
jgi:hypothetical protein